MESNSKERERERERETGVSKVKKEREREVGGRPDARDGGVQSEANECEACP